MKFAHIADLHIGKRVNDFSMLEEQRYIFKEIIEDNENYVEAVADANLQAELIKLFTNEVGKLVESLPDEF